MVTDIEELSIIVDTVNIAKHNRKDSNTLSS
jgi:hypothetical protein